MPDFNKLAEHQSSPVLDAIVASGFPARQKNREQQQEEAAQLQKPTEGWHNRHYG